MNDRPSRSAAETRHWRARPVARLLVKAAILLVPVVAGTLAAMGLAAAVPPPAHTAARLAWAVLLLGTSTITVMAVERVVRRLGPLVLLLRLSLVFPDQAPRRFGLALRAIRPSRRLVEADEPLEAKDSLVLLASLLAHDRRTRGHSERVAAYATMIAEELPLDAEERARLTWGALLHDIGKLEVPARILNKPGALDDAEWRIMAGHPAFGARLVDPLRPWLGDALSAVDGHHERFDGTGYPYRRASERLPVAARVVALADAFEVMTAARSYKQPMSIAAARAEVAACAGAHFDPQVARAFLGLSVPRLWLMAGPMAWLAQVPLVGLVARGELVPAALATTTQAVTAAAVVGGALVATGATGLGGASVDEVPSAMAIDDGAHARSGQGGGAADGADDAGTAGGGAGGHGHGGSSGDGSGDPRGQGVDPSPGGGADPAPSTPTGGGGGDTPADPDPDPSTPDPSTPAGGGGGVGGVVDPVVDGVDDIVGGVVGDDDPVGGIVDPVVDDVDDVVGGVLGGLGLPRR